MGTKIDAKSIGAPLHTRLGHELSERHVLNQSALQQKDAIDKQRPIMLRIIICIVFLCLMPHASFAQFTRSYPNIIELSAPLNMRLHWNITGSRFYGGLEADTTGWAAFGFGPSPFGMSSSDILLAYTSGPQNTPFIGDYWAFGNLQPSLDSSQDWTLVAGSRAGSRLRVEFERLLSTGDTTRDRVISRCNPISIIWATGAQIPATPSTPQQHESTTVGGIASYRFCIHCVAPSVPRNFTRVRTGRNWVQVSWVAPSSDGGSPIESYDITLVPAGGTDAIVRSVSGTQVRANITDLPYSTTFSITVQATQCFGTSDLSTELSYTSGVAPPMVPIPPSLPPQKPPVQAPVASLYTGEVRLLGGNLVVRWGVPVNSSAVYFQVEGKTNGWVGLGHGGRIMVDSDIMMGYVDDGSQATVVGDFWSSGETAPRLDVTRGGRSDFFGVKGTQANGVTTISFARNLSTSDTQDRPWILGDNDIIVAMADSDSFSTQHYTATTAKISLSPNGGSALVGTSAATPGRIVHAALMTVGWGVATLLGIVIARYGKIRFAAPLWFRYHMILQIGGFLISLTGMIIVFATNTSHFTTQWHAQLGIAIMGGAVIQLLMGFIRPDPPKNFKDKKTKKRVAFEWAHGIFGKVVMIGAIVTIFSGLLQMAVPTFGIIIVAVYFGLALGGAIVLEILKCRRGKDT